MLNSMPAKNIVIVVGEGSGDAHAARVITHLKQHEPSINIKGIGGENLREAGVEIVTDFSELAVMGLIEVLKRYRKIKAIFNQMVHLLKAEKPDLLILVDYPGFNLKLAKEAKKIGVPVLYYISPKVWAWRAGRVKTIKKSVDHMAVLFPFEVPIYEAESIPVTCVGHPLVDAVTVKHSNSQAKEKLGFEAKRLILGVFPGSRESEVKTLLPIMLDAAKKLQKTQKNIDIVLPVAQGLDLTAINTIVATSTIDVNIIEDDFYTVTTACDAIVAASGTVTLEIALLGVPHFIVYRVSPLSYSILSRFIKIPYVGLCNIVTGKNLVLELLQNDVTAIRLAEELTPLLQKKDAKKKAEEIQQQIRAALGQAGGADNAAKLIIKLLGSHQ